MKITTSLCVTALLQVLLAFTTVADVGIDLGHRTDTFILPSPDTECEDSLYVHHDYTFENGFCWGYGGVSPPYYGAFGESFDLGSGFIECGAFWFTIAGMYWPCQMDVYVWEGGITGPPGNVLSLSHGHVPENVPFWPAIGQNDFAIELDVTAEFTIGFWADYSLAICPYFIAADIDGLGGYPWVNIQPGVGYPTGWQHPSVIWGTTQSMGIGAYFRSPPTPIASETWGRMKALFAR